MTVRTKLNLIVLIIVALLIVFIGTNLFLISRLNKTSNKAHVAAKITEFSFELALLRSEYLAHPTERPKVQWISVHENQTRFLEESNHLFIGSADRELFEKIFKASLESGALFGQLVQSLEEGGNQTVTEELNNQLTIKAQARVSDALSLAELNRQQAASDIRILLVTIIILGGSFGAIAVGSYIASRKLTEKEAQIDKAKTEFVSLASHQLRTPLSTVNWYAEMLLAGDAGNINDEQKKYLEEIYTGNQRMVELVNALLNVSRLELGTFVVEPKPTDIIKLAESVISEQMPQIVQKKLQFTPLFEKNIPIISADSKLIRMVFQNLLSNAVKYTPDEGKIKLSISLDKEKKGIIFTVSDTGYGIPKNQQDKIFTKLFRADNVREKDTEGTGLGLYIVKSIIEQSDGKIWFESEKDKGTTFYVILPLKGMKEKVGTKALAQK